MTTLSSDKRVHTRSQYFRVQAGSEVLSYFTFRPEDALDAVPALVVDISEGGVQVLTANPQGFAQSDYSLELLSEDAADQAMRHDVHLVWSRPDGVNTRCGFAFAAGGAAEDQVGALLAASSNHILRCVLYPL
ncbi:MAG: hypothetical protein CFE44_03380 [Burkholderiales bacterium PBB4]|nr:MAG: hypothetical protein CFE44_03380 [Burkholderiales bacterium PBB4]